MVEVIESITDEKDESSFKQESRSHHEIIVNVDKAEARRKSDESNRGADVEENDVVRIENGDRSKDKEIEDRSRQLESKYVDERASDTIEEVNRIDTGNIPLQEKESMLFMR